MASSPAHRSNGHGSNGGGVARACYTCGGAHHQRQCPNRNNAHHNNNHNNNNNGGNGNGNTSGGVYSPLPARVSSNAALVGARVVSPSPSPPLPSSSAATATSPRSSSSSGGNEGASSVPSNHQHVNLTRYGTPMNTAPSYGIPTSSSSPSLSYPSSSSSGASAAATAAAGAPGQCFACGGSGHLRRDCPGRTSGGSAPSSPHSPHHHHHAAHGYHHNRTSSSGASTPSSVNGNGVAVLTPHPPVAIGSLFDYLIIVDFEATCDEPTSPVTKPSITRENQEIIEFPWVVIDVSTRTIIDSKQMFVKPEWMPTLTAFCTKLTGITQDKVTNAAPLSDVLIAFDTYVTQQFDEKKKSFALVTDGEWDLKICLRSEAIKKKLTRAFAGHYLNYFDVKRAFAHLYRVGSMTAPKHSLKSMLALLGIPLVGHHHSGIDDCTNIASIVLRLMNDGYPFAHGGLTMIPSTYDPVADTSVHDFATGPRQRFAPIGGPGGTVMIEEPSGDDTTIVRVRGLPWSANETDIRNFFGTSLPIVGVTFVLNVSKKPTGTGFVEFASAEAAGASHARHNNSMGHRYIEVFRSSHEQRASVLASVWH